jgi:ABC-2 type transport system ATP-binding protein
VAYAIETRGLTKDFGEGKGILDLSIQVRPGLVYGFLGPNGAGKTTTLRLLMGFLKPDSGDARLLGHPIRADRATLNRLIGFVPGELALPDHMTGRRFLEDSATLRGGVDPAWRQRLVDELDAQLDPRIRTLSKGNRQKIALIDALQHRPPLLILDEPTDGLDPLLRHRVQLLLREHAKAGGTVFLSSHVVHEIQTTCDRVFIVMAGRLRREDDVATLLAREPARIEASVADVGLAAKRLATVRGISDLERHGQRIRFQSAGALLPTMQALIDVKATDVVVRHDLEDTFLRLYEEVAR